MIIKYFIIAAALMFSLSTTAQGATSNATSNEGEVSSEAAQPYYGDSFYGPPYYYDRYPYYWYPEYYYYSHEPYAAPRGRWVSVVNLANRLEKQIDALKNLADDIEDRTGRSEDKRTEEFVEQFDRAADRLHDEFARYGVYSPDYIDALIQNVNYHARALTMNLQSNEGSAVARSFVGIQQTLASLQSAYAQIRP